MACASAPMRGPSRSPERITANTCNVKGTGVTGIVIWAAAAVTAAIKAARVMVDAFNASLSAQETIAPATTVRPRFPAPWSSSPLAFGLPSLRVKRYNKRFRDEEEQVGLGGSGGRKDKD